jgi:uncharacterized RDD family membrane protein YckC
LNYDEKGNVVETGTAESADPGAYAAPGAQVPDQGVAIRFVALLIDAIILGIISYILIFLFAASAITVDTSTGAVSIGPAYYAAVALGIVIELLYFTLLLGRYGQSVGMMVVKIKVVSEADSGPITYGAAFIRTIPHAQSHSCSAQYLFGLPFYATL